MRRRSGRKYDSLYVLVTVLEAVAYLGFELLILWLALLAVHAHPTPGFAIVVMA